MRTRLSIFSVLLWGPMALAQPAHPSDGTALCAACHKAEAVMALPQVAREG